MIFHYYPNNGNMMCVAYSPSILVLNVKSYFINNFLLAAWKYANYVKFQGNLLLRHAR